MANDYASWNAGYEIKVETPSSTAGFQGTIVIPYLPGMRADFRDLRFADQNGNPLTHSRESFTAFNSARFWIRLPANQTKIIMYYGNGGVSSASNPAATFDFWDDFLGTSINSTLWNIGGSGGTVSGSILTLQHSSMSGYIESKTLFAPNSLVEMRMSHQSGQRGPCGFRSQSTQRAAAWQGAAGSVLNDFRFSHNGSTGDWDDDGVNRSGVYHIYGVAHIAAGPRYYVNYQYRGEQTSIIPGAVNLPIQFYAYSGEGYVRVDWVRIRRYAATEPTLTLGRKFVQSGNGFLQQHDYISDSVVTYVSTESSIKDTFTDSVSTKLSTGFSIGPPDLIEDDITTICSIEDGPIIDRVELRDYSLISCEISKSITDAYMQLSAEFADSKVPDEDSTVKYYAHLDSIGGVQIFTTDDDIVFTTADDILFTVGEDVVTEKKLLFWGKVIANSLVFGSYYSTLRMQAADASRNLAVQKIPWNYQVVSLEGIYDSWPAWIAAIVDYSSTGVLVKRIVDSGMPEKQFVFKPETTRLEALKEICSYCDLIINIKLVEHENIIVPGFFAVPASEIDQTSGGFDLPQPINFESPEGYSIIDQPSIEGVPDEKYNMVTVYGVITSTGETTVASAYIPAVDQGVRAREYRIQDNSIEEKESSAEIEAIKWLLYFQAPRATVSMRFINRFDFELYQRIRFGSGFPLKIQELTRSTQLPYIIAYDPRDEENTKHTVDVSGVPRPEWLRISEVRYRSEMLTEHVELKLITDFIYSSADQVVPEPYSQYISPGYTKPVSDDSASTIQDIVDDTIKKQLSPENCTLLSINTNNGTAVVQTVSGKLVTVMLGGSVFSPGQKGVMMPSDDGHYIFVPSDLGPGEDTMHSVVSVTVYGATGDGENDDTEAFVKAFSSGAKNFFVPDGTYLISSGISVPEHAVLYGESVNSTTIKTPGSGTPFNVVKPLKGATVKNLTVDVNNLDASGILIDHASDVKLFNVRVCNSGYHGIALTYATYCQIENVETDHNMHRGILIDPYNYGNVLNGIYSHDNELAGVLIGHGSHDNVISNFVIEGTNNCQFWIHNESYNNVIKNGIIRNPTSASSPGILLGANSHHNIVSDLVITGQEVGVLLRGSDVDVGWTAGDTRQNVLNSIIINGPGSGVSGSIGVKMDSLNGGTNKVSRNRIQNVTISGFQSGFRSMNGGATDTLENAFYDCDASIDIGNPWNIGAVAGLGNNILRNLVGYTPRGSLVSEGQPAVPATSVPVLNPFPFPCSVIISNMTSGGVAINGVNTASPFTNFGNGPYYLDVGQTIQLIYSSGSPAWRWWGLS